MIVGLPERFAIQYAIVDRSTQWLNGKFSYLANKAVIGDYENGASLATAATGISRLLEHSGKRSDPRLLTLSTSDLFKRIHSALFRDDARTNDKVRFDSEHFSKFDVASFLDVFDRWHCFLIEGNGVGRFLYAELGKIDHPFEIALYEGEFDEVCRQFLRSIDKLGCMKKS